MPDLRVESRFALGPEIIRQDTLLNYFQTGAEFLAAAAGADD